MASWNFQYIPCRDVQIARLYTRVANISKTPFSHREKGGHPDPANGLGMTHVDHGDLQMRLVCVG